MAHTLELNLYNPMMTPYHRCGLGGIACVLNYADKFDIELQGGTYSWDSTSVTFAMDDPQEFMKSLYELAFQIREDTIYLPAVMMENIPKDARQKMQESILSTILQSHNGREVTSQEKSDPKQKGRTPAKMSSYHQQTAYQLLFKTNRKNETTFTDENLRILNYVIPGFVEKHPGHNTYIEQPYNLTLMLHFFLLGAPCFNLAKNTSLFNYSVEGSPKKDQYGGCVVIPDVANLKEFAARRPLLYPANPEGYTVQGLGDAVLRTKQKLQHSAHNVEVYFMDSAAWSPQQKNRLRSLDFDYEAINNNDLNFAESVWTSLGDSSQWYRYTYVASLVFTNIAQKKPWWTDFNRVIPTAESFEILVRTKSAQTIKGCLQMMTNKMPQEAPKLLIDAIHNVLALRYYSIMDEMGGIKWQNMNEGQQQRFQKRFYNQLQTFYQDIKNSGTHNLFVNTINRILSRSALDYGKNRILQDHYEPTLRNYIFNRQSWREVQSLALVALATYKWGTFPANSNTQELELANQGA